MWPSWNPRLLGESKCPFFPGVTLSYLMSYREFQDTFIISECVCVYMWVCNTYALCLIWRKNYGNVNFICFIHMYLYRENYSNFLDCWSLEDWLWENTCVCVYTYMCIYTHMHIHTYMYICAYIYTYVHTHIYIYVHMHMYFKIPFPKIVCHKGFPGPLTRLQFLKGFWPALSGPSRGSCCQPPVMWLPEAGCCSFSLWIK